MIYHLSAPDAAGKVSASADKIVDGKPVSMGVLTFEYNKEKQTLECVDGPRTWHLQINGGTMNGTLMISDTLVRKVELTKD